MKIICKMFGHRFILRSYVDACSIEKCVFKPFRLPALGIARREAGFNGEKGFAALVENEILIR